MYGLARRLGIERALAVGTMECLWHWTARYAPRGDIGRYPDPMIAEGALWKGEPAALMSALIAERWVDVHSQYRLLVHNWHKHSDDAVKKYLSRNELTFAFMSRRRPDRVRTVAAVEALLVAPAVAVAVAEPMPLPLPLPDALLAGDFGPPKNPLMGTVAGDRASWESRWATAVTLLSELTDRDPVEVAREHSLYPGAKTAKLNPASMSEDRLMHTVVSLEAALAAARARQASAPALAASRERMDQVLQARAAEPPTVSSIARLKESLAGAFAAQALSYEAFCESRRIPVDVADEAGLRALCERAS